MKLPAGIRETMYKHTLLRRFLKFLKDDFNSPGSGHLVKVNKK